MPRPWRTFLWCFLSALLFGVRFSPPYRQEVARAAQVKPSDASPPGHADRYGDPLPADAVTRLGTARLLAASDRICFTANGRRLLTQGRREPLVVREWDTQSGRQTRTLKTSGPLLAADPAGRLLAVRGENVEIVDIKTGARKMTIDKSLRGAGVFFPDGKTLVVGGLAARWLELWDVERGAFPETRAELKSSAEVLALSADGKYLAAGEIEGALEVWDAKTWKRIHSWDAHQEAVTAIGIRPAGDLLATGGMDETIKLWSIKTGRLVKVLEGHQGCVTSLAFSPDGKLLASASTMGPARLWDVETGRVAHRFRHRGETLSVAFSPDGKTLALGGSAVYLWDLQARREKTNLERHYRPVRTLAVSADGRTVITGGDDGAICWWDRTSGRRTGWQWAHDKGVQCVALSPDGHTLASVGAENDVTLWDNGKKVAKAELVTDQLGLLSVAFAREPGVLALGAKDGSVKLWKTETRTLLRALPTHAGPVRAMAFSPDGTLLAVADANAVSLWCWERGVLIGKAPRSDCSLSFSKDGRWLAVGNRRGELALVETASGKLVEIYSAGSVGLMCFLTQRKALVIANDVWSKIVIWDLAADKACAEIPNKAGQVQGIGLVPGSNLLVTAHEDGATLVWDLTRFVKRLK
jgi:WD40 repeat protein